MCLSFSALNRFVVFAVVPLYAFVVNSGGAHWRSTKAGQGTYQGREGCETAQKTTNLFREDQPESDKLNWRIHLENDKHI